MAIYGVDFLGSEYYGFPPYVEFDANPFTVEPLGFGQLRLSWVPPSGDWSTLRVVRNSYGAPDYEDDGVTIAEYTTDAVSEIVDSDLTQGRFFYYSIFVLSTEIDSWVRAATGMGLVIKDHDYDGIMFQWLPGWFQDQDDYLAEARFSKPPYGDGPLRRYLKVVGTSASYIRTEYETLRDLNNPDRVSGNLIPALAQKVHVPFEPAIGMRRSRFWARDAVFLYRRKGTIPGIEGVVSTITGWGARVEYGTNLLKGIESKAWVLLDGGSIEDDTDRSDFDDGDVVTTITGSPSWQISNYEDDPGTLRHHAISISPNIYTIQGQFRAIDGIGTVVATAECYSIDGTFIESFTSDPLETSEAEWLTLSFDVGFGSSAVFEEEFTEYFASASATPAYVRVFFEGDHDVRFRRAGISQGSNTAWQPPSALEIMLLPARENYVLNPSFEMSLVTWSIDEGVLQRTDAYSAYTRNSVMEVSEAAGTSVIVGGPYRIEDTNVPYTMSIRTPSSSPEMRVRWENASGTIIASSSWETPSDPDANDWRALGVTSIPPSNAAACRVEIRAQEGDYFDAAMLEQAENVSDYFDGSFFGADYLWAGDDDLSASRYYPGRTIRHNRLQEILPTYLPVGQSFQLTYVSGESYRGSATTGALGVGTLGRMSAG